MEQTFSTNQLHRYPIYLKYLKELEADGQEYISSPVISKALGYSEEQVRKDLQAVSQWSGTPKKGRDVKHLIESLETFLGYRDASTAVVIGAGHLGGALLNYPLFKDIGLTVVAGFDSDSAKVGKPIGDKPVFSMEKLNNLAPRLNAHIAIIAVPASAAQSAASAAVQAGIRGIWNFAPVHLDVPSGVVVEDVNLASSLAVLSHRLNTLLSKED